MPVEVMNDKCCSILYLEQNILNAMSNLQYLSKRTPIPLCISDFACPLWPIWAVGGAPIFGQTSANNDCTGASLT